MKLNPILRKMNIINNNLTPIISYNKMITNGNNNIIKEENKTNFQALKRIENILSSNNNISSDKISFKTELKPLKIYSESTFLYL